MQEVERQSLVVENGWEIAEEEFRPEKSRRYEALFALGNGYIGTRGTFEEGLDGDLSLEGTFLNGFYESHPIIYGEMAYAYADTTQTMLNVPNGKSIRVYVEDECFNLLCGRILSYRRSLDLRQGLLRRSVVWESPGGRRLRLEYERLVSLGNKHILAVKCTVTPLGFDGRIRLESSLDARVSNMTAGNDPRGGSGFDIEELATEAKAFDGGIGMIRLRTGNSGLALACAMAHDIQTVSDYDMKPVVDRHALTAVFDVDARRDRPVSVFKYVTYVDSLDYSVRMDQTAIAIATRARQRGFKGLEREQETFLDGFWSRTDVALEGDTMAQQGLRLNIFHLLQSTGRDGRTSVSAKGLSSQGYAGHYFWEAEVYVLPFFLHSYPEIARKLLEFRYRTLDKARERARQMSHAKGALFAWRTINGEECSAYYPAGTAQYHIDADIALAVQRYVEATGDEDFLANCGAEIVIETARFWADLGTFSDRKGGRFCLNGVTGPDEYTALVDNNYYTNIMARENLLYAYRTVLKLRGCRNSKYASLAARLHLDEEEPECWKRAAEAMYLPYDEELGVHPQDDTFLGKEEWDFARTPPEHYPLLLHYHPLVLYRHQVCKQADVVLALFQQGDKFSLDEKRRDYDYYERLTTHDSSLSTSVFSVMASETGRYDKAYQYFLRSVRMDMDDLQGNTDTGVHIANMAGSWMAVVNGFGGMRAYDGKLTFRPYLPARLGGYSFHATFQNSTIRVTVGPGKVTYELMEGETIAFTHCGIEVRLSDKSPVRCLPGDYTVTETPE